MIILLVTIQTIRSVYVYQKCCLQMDVHTLKHPNETQEENQIL